MSPIPHPLRVAAAALWLSEGAGCAAGAPSPPTPEGPVEPTHSAVAAAVADDAELARWAATPADYILRPGRADLGLRQHTLWFLIPTDVPHPISVTLASDAAGRALRTTGQPEAAWRVLAVEGAPVEGDAAGALVHELLRDHGRHQAYVPGSTAVQVEGIGWQVGLSVDDRVAGRQRWTAVLDGPHSALSITTER